ncbi:hypothetical protein [Paraburkholderia sp. HP33-1]|uniref:hypothetical protein n=1 Tax=Paraburkholderia sp. HP33-1 TaxID=2883243 RepID=UPI001F36F3D2|nr:hypothetical protein [Paraburkholderia sp. HP33-1]
MNTLMIKDLSNTEQLDSKAMSAVRGGNGYYPFLPSYFSSSYVYSPTSIKNVSTTQMINTEMDIQSANGNNSAFVGGTTTKIEPHVTSNNSSYVY